MLLTLLSASIMQRSENGTHYKWNVHSSLPSRRYRERKCHASWPVMPAPEIRLLRFDFLPPSPYIVHPPPSLLHTLLPRQSWSPKTTGDIDQSIPYLFHQNWHWNSYFALLYLFPAAAIALAHNRNGCYRTTPFSVLPLISFFLPLKDDPFCCHKRNESFLWVLWIMPHSQGPFLNVQILVAAG